MMLPFYRSCCCRLLLLLLLLPLASCRGPYDLLIRNGEVFTGDGTPARRADIGIRNERIADIVPDLSRRRARRMIDATGLAVSPGFIDVHAHLEPLPLDPEAQSHVRQGVTTALGGPDGGGPLPLGDYLDSLTQLGIGLNVGYLVGHNTVRAYVMGLENRRPTPAELDFMRRLVDTAMVQGAFGLSTGLKYLPGAFSELDEVVALARVAAARGGIYTSHLREEGLGLIEGVAEAVTIAERAGIPVVLTHHKAIGKPMWGASARTLSMVDSARSLGLDILIDQYPYTASHTSLSVLIPAWALEGGPISEFARRCQDSLLRDSIRQGIVFNLLNDRGGGDLRRIQFSTFNWKPELEGKTLYDWAVQEGQEPTLENGADLIIEAQLHRGANCIFHVIDEGDVRRILQHPQTMIASDGRLSQPGYGHPHPRAYGTFPRVLGHYVREEQVLDLPTAIYKMTGLPARCLGLTDRGLLRRGWYADLTLFNPADVADVATFEDPHRYAAGIPFVIINGQLVVDGGEYRDVRAGKVLRKGVRSEE